jgi:hypothetical protein
VSASRVRFAWVLNLDAEFELARPGYAPRVRLTSQLDRFGTASRALLGDEDVLVAPDVTVPSGFVGRAWCPTPGAMATLRAAGVTPEPHPEASILRRVNHRRFAFELGGGLPDQRYLETRAALEPLLVRAERPWLLKRPLAFAGRGQMRAYATLTEKQWSWIDASFRTDGLIVEPLVTPTLEVSLHGFVWSEGRHELGRMCVQEVTARGVFRGVRLAVRGELTSSEEREITAQGERVARALHEAGYFGPFGIDAYRYERDGAPGFCALSEINARYTMGFVIGFPRHPSELRLG